MMKHKQTKERIPTNGTISSHWEDMKKKEKIGAILSWGIQTHKNRYPGSSAKPYDGENKLVLYFKKIIPWRD